MVFIIALHSVTPSTQQIERAEFYVDSMTISEQVPILILLHSSYRQRENAVESVLDWWQNICDFCISQSGFVAQREMNCRWEIEEANSNYFYLMKSIENELNWGLYYDKKFEKLHYDLKLNSINISSYFPLDHTWLFIIPGKPVFSLTHHKPQ